MFGLKQSYNPLRDNLPLLRREKNGLVIGETSLFTKGRRKFVHGADIMLPVGRMIQELLGDEEGVSMVETVRFLDVCTHDLSIFASTDEGLLPSGGAKPTLVMRCKTKKRRTVYISAYSTGAPIAHHSPDGVMLEKIDGVMGDPEIRNGSEIVMKMAGLNTDYFCSRNPYLYLHIAIEIFSVATLRLKKHHLLPDSKLLLTGMDDIAPPCRDDIAVGIALKIDIRNDKNKVTRSGAVITPIEFSYYDNQNRIKPYATPYIAPSPTGRFEHLEKPDSPRLDSSPSPLPFLRFGETMLGRSPCLA